MKMYLSGFCCGVFWVFGRLRLGLDHHSSKHSEHTTADTQKVYFYFSPFNCCFVTCKRGLSWKSTHLVLSHYISILLTLKFYMFGSCLRTLAVILVSHLKKYFLVLSIKQPGRPNDTLESFAHEYLLFFFSFLTVDNIENVSFTIYLMSAFMQLMFCLQLQPQHTPFHRHPASLSLHNFKLNGGEGRRCKEIKKI